MLTTDVEDNDTANAKFLAFELNKRMYAIDIMNIREIMEYSDVEPVPLMPDYVEGAINLRGSVIAVINLHRRLGIEDKKNSHKTCIVIVEVYLGDVLVEVGFKVDAVNQVFDVKDAYIEDTPSLGGQLDTHFIQKMGKINGNAVVLLDTKKVLTIDQIESLVQLEGN
jgi:purine-binding chemotaxis protein CheW